MKKKYVFLPILFILLLILIISFFKFDRFNSHIYTFSYEKFSNTISFKVNLSELDSTKERVVYEGYNTKIILKKITENDKNIFITIDSITNWKLFSGKCLSRIIVLNNSSKNVLSTNADINENIYYENGEKVPYRVCTGPKNKMTFIFDKNVIKKDVINIDFNGYKICQYNLILGN